LALFLLTMWDMGNKSKKKGWFSIPPWLIIGGMAILLPLFFFMTLVSINRQREGSRQLLVEKGAALIRSFEAGARTGMMGMSWGGPQVQRLLTQTAQQPDILYIMVTDRGGRIVAHNDAEMIGRRYVSGVDPWEASRTRQVAWRERNLPNGQKVFEVYRRFMPIRGPLNRMHGGMMGRMRGDWCSVFMQPGGPRQGQGYAIFVGLDMGPVEEAQRRNEQHFIFMAVLLLLAGAGGLVTLFLAQAYRSARTSLSEVRAFSDRVVETMPMGLAALDNRLKVMMFNRTAKEILDRKRADTGSDKTRVPLPEELQSVARSVKDSERTIEKELVIEASSGKEIPLEVIATPLRAEEDMQALGVLLLFRDLSEIKHLKEEVARSQRLASIGRLAAGVAHEIRNPLSSIKGFATYFKERYKNIPEDQKIAGIMIQEVDRLNRVITQLLEFARPPQIQKKRTNLVGLTMESIQMVEQDAEKRSVEISFQATNEQLVAYVDPDRIKQVLLNLYLNSLEAMEGGGTLSVSISLDTDGDYVLIQVRDSGKGIADTDLPHVFEPYFTTKPSGTGLGLAIAHKIVESHGGDLRVFSEKGKGTEVIVRLPLKDG